MTTPVTAVIMARGLGRRMQADDPAVSLSGSAATAAAAGVKTLVPDAVGRPLIDHILTSLADAGVARVVMVVAPEHDSISDHFAARPPGRLALEYAVQQQPQGTADALLAAESRVRGGQFLLLNADNLYPAAAVTALIGSGRPGLIGFDRDGLVSGGIPAERVRAFGLIETDDDGNLRRIVEKPSDSELAALPADAPVSMNLWYFDDGIFECCRDVEVSVRGERELPQAVSLHLDRGACYAVVPHSGQVFDLSRRADIAATGRLLAHRQVDT